MIIEHAPVSGQSRLASFLVQARSWVVLRLARPMGNLVCQDATDRPSSGSGARPAPPTQRLVGVSKVIIAGSWIWTL